MDAKDAEIEALKEEIRNLRNELEICHIELGEVGTALIKAGHTPEGSLAVAVQTLAGERSAWAQCANRHLAAREARIRKGD